MNGPSSPRSRWRAPLLVVGIALTGLMCAVCMIAGAPSSRAYRSGTPREEAALRQSRQDVYPGQVRDDPARFAQTNVAWAGIIRHFELVREPEQLRMRFDVEHRYFDWIEDHSIQRAWYFVSPRGEGAFHVEWTLPLEAEAEMRATVHNGELLLAFGRPRAPQSGVINVDPVLYLRYVPRWMWRDDVMDYGRPGTPTRHLSTPMR